MDTQAKLSDDQVKEYAANIIAGNMLTQVDSDGMRTPLMETIVDHQRDEEKELQHHDKYVQTKNGRCISGRPQKVGSYSSTGKTYLHLGLNWLI